MSLTQEPGRHAARAPLGKSVSNGLYVPYAMYRHLRLCSGFFVRARGGGRKAQARTVFVQRVGPRQFRAGRRIGQVGVGSGGVAQTPRKPPVGPFGTSAGVRKRGGASPLGGARA